MHTSVNKNSTIFNSSHSFTQRSAFHGSCKRCCLKKLEKRTDAWCARDKVEMEIQKLKIESHYLEFRFLDRIFKIYVKIKIPNIIIVRYRMVQGV